MLKEQSQDIKELVVRMRDQFFTLRDKNLQELEEIQRKFELEVTHILMLEKRLY